MKLRGCRCKREERPAKGCAALVPGWVPGTQSHQVGVEYVRNRNLRDLWRER